MMTTIQGLRIEKVENGFEIAITETTHGFSSPAIMVPQKVFVELDFLSAHARIGTLIKGLKSISELNQSREGERETFLKKLEVKPKR